MVCPKPGPTAPLPFFDNEAPTRGDAGISPNGCPPSPPGRQAAAPGQEPRSKARWHPSLLSQFWRDSADGIQMPCPL